MYSSPLFSTKRFWPRISRLPPGRTRTTWTEICPVNELDCAVDPDPVKLRSLLEVKAFEMRSSRSDPGIIPGSDI